MAGAAEAELFAFQNRVAIDAAPRAESQAADKAESIAAHRTSSGTLPPIVLIGEPVLMTSLAASVQKKTGTRTFVFGATENSAPFLGSVDAALRGEEELEQALSRIVGACTEGQLPVRVIADPCYVDVLPKGCALVRLPHLAFSGRIFLQEIPDLFQDLLT